MGAIIWVFPGATNLELFGNDGQAKRRNLQSSSKEGIMQEDAIMSEGAIMPAQEVFIPQDTLANLPRKNHKYWAREELLKCLKLRGTSIRSLEAQLKRSRERVHKLQAAAVEGVQRSNKQQAEVSCLTGHLLVDHEDYVHKSKNCVSQLRAQCGDDGELPE